MADSFFVTHRDGELKIYHFNRKVYVFPKEAPPGYDLGDWHVHLFDYQYNKYMKDGTVFVESGLSLYYRLINSYPIVAVERREFLVDMEENLYSPYGLTRVGQLDKPEDNVHVVPDQYTLKSP